jgi:hypothetical protein
MKLAVISEKKEGLSESQTEDLVSNSKIRNIRDLYRGISDFKEGYQPRTTMVKRQVTGSQSPKLFWLDEGTLSPSY